MIDTSWIDGLVGYRIRRASAAVSAAYDPSEDPVRLRAVHVLILDLIDRSEGSTASAIGAVLGIQRPNMTALVAELNDTGLIERSPSPDDRRAVTLRLTAAGSRAVDAGRVRIEQLDDRLTEGFEPSEVAQLCDLLDRVMASLSGP